MILWNHYGLLVQLVQPMQRAQYAFCMIPRLGARWNECAEMKLGISWRKSVSLASLKPTPWLPTETQSAKHGQPLPTLAAGGISFQKKYLPSETKFSN